MKKPLTKKQIKEEILRNVALQEEAYWGEDQRSYLCNNLKIPQFKGWLEKEKVLTFGSSNVTSSHFLCVEGGLLRKSAIFRTMILIEFAKSLGVKI